MKTSDIVQIAQTLTRHNMTDHLSNGEKAIPVSLTLKGEYAKGQTRAEMKETLRKIFFEKLQDLFSKGLEADYRTIAVSGQIITAKLEIQQLPALLQALAERDIDVQPIEKLQLVSDRI